MSGWNELTEVYWYSNRAGGQTLIPRSGAHESRGRLVKSKGVRDW